jgi:DNA primase
MESIPKRLKNELTPDKIKEMLDAFDVPYIEQGKNVSSDYYGMTCPFCDDDSDHLGIHRTKGFYTCWKCKAYGSFFELLQEVADVTWEQYQEALGIGTVEETSALSRINDILNPPNEQFLPQSRTLLDLPKHTQTITPATYYPLLEEWLEKRKFSLVDCVRHRCSFGKGGEWTHRLLIPIFYKSEMVSFVGADMTGRSWLKYKMSETSVNDFLYDLDRIKRTRIIVTEGILDCWRIQKLTEDVVCTFGTHITKEQSILILNKQLQELVLAWDGDAYWKARREAKRFQAHIKNIKIVQFPKHHDPDSYGREEGLDALSKLIEETEIL